jgi:hypothetical protein
VADALHFPVNSQVIDGYHFCVRKKDSRLDDSRRAKFDFYARAADTDLSNGGSSCQAPSGQLPFSLCFPYPAWASAHHAVLHTPTIVFLRQIPRLHRAATGTPALTGRKSSSAGTCVRSMNQGNKQLLEGYLELPPQPDRSRPTRRLRHCRFRQLTLRFH